MSVFNHSLLNEMVVHPYHYKSRFPLLVNSSNRKPHARRGASSKASGNRAWNGHYSLCLQLHTSPLGRIRTSNAAVYPASKQILAVQFTGVAICVRALRAALTSQTPYA
jgi:hypothetical protein